MKNFTIYKTDTGQITKTGFGNEISIQLSIDQDESVLYVESNCLTQYVSNGNIIDFPPKPNGSYVFNYTTKQWDPDFDQQSYLVKQKRDKLLYESDWTQIPNNSLTPEVQQEWAIYRQELRDVTSQPGYPFNVIWPVQPQ